MGNEDEIDLFNLDHLTLENGETFGVPKNMTCESRTLIIKHLNLINSEKDKENPDPLWQRYHHRIGNIIGNLQLMAYTTPPDQQPAKFRGIINQLIDNDPNIKPFLEKLGVNITNS